jgi:hypothetical protein
MNNQHGIMLSAKDLTARIVQVGTIEPFWAVSILDEGIKGFRRLDAGGPWHEEPTEEKAKEWAENYLRHQMEQDISSLDWTGF